MLDISVVMRHTIRNCKIFNFDQFPMHGADRAAGPLRPPHSLRPRRPRGCIDCTHRKYWGIPGKARTDNLELILNPCRCRARGAAPEAAAAASRVTSHRGRDRRHHDSLMMTAPRHPFLRSIELQLRIEQRPGRTAAPACQSLRVALSLAAAAPGPSHCGPVRVL